LLIPDELAGRSIERDEAVVVKTVAEALAAVVFGASARSDGDKHEAALGIEGHETPYVGAEFRVPTLPEPGFVAGLSGLRLGVKGPDELAGVGVPCANGLHPVFSGDHEIVIDDGCGGGARAANEAAIAESVGRLAGFRVEREHLT